MTNFEMVKEFHKKMGLPDSEGYPCIFLSHYQLGLRNRLILEELSEYNKAVCNESIVETADALADLLYVVYGTAVEHGIDIDRVFKEVHRSNMTKKPGNLDASGKLLKSEGYEPPNLSFLLE